MINKQLEKITLADINDLIQNEVAEGKSIEYKKELSSSSDADKKEFLADISSFSNTIGGDLLYGVLEENGVPTSVTGLEISDIDAEIRKYENIVRDGIEPRVGISTHVVKLDEKKVVLIFRMAKSWLGPHRVIFKGHDKFYARNSAGKYPLDVSELRTAFNLSQTLTERINRFKTERIMELVANNTPIPFCEGAKLVLHIIPFESFEPTFKVDMQSDETIRNLRPIQSGGWNHRINLEGIVTYTGENNNPASTYTQIYRNGIIEAVNNRMLQKGHLGLHIPCYSYEEQTMEYLKVYLNFLKKLNVSVPIVVYLTFTGVKDYRLGVGSGFFEQDYPMDRDILQLPEVIIDSFDVDIKEVLRPLFDLVWNAFGYERSFNFDEQGNWVKR